MLSLMQRIEISPFIVIASNKKDVFGGYIGTSLCNPDCRLWSRADSGDIIWEPEFSQANSPFPYTQQFFSKFTVA